VGATVAWETIAWKARSIKATMDIEENMKQLVGIELSSGQETNVLLERKKLREEKRSKDFISFVGLHLASGDPQLHPQFQLRS
jgi:hypothetical protein